MKVHWPGLLMFGHGGGGESRRSWVLFSRHWVGEWDAVF